jgi:hypothetical protein
MIKNTTPYLGKIRLKFERFPYYSGKDKLNKIHLNLGFTKLISRITPLRDELGWVVNPVCIDLIEKNTGLRVRTHKFGTDEEYVLPNSCISPDGVYVGDIETGWWYYKHGLRSIKGTHPSTAWSKETKKWIGYSHRASCAFGKGDKLFDASWKPSDEELPLYKQYYEKYLKEYYKEQTEWAKSDSKHKAPEEEMTLNSWAVGHIPFKFRGGAKISSYEQAYEAAVNFAKYIS